MIYPLDTPGVLYVGRYHSYWPTYMAAMASFTSTPSENEVLTPFWRNVTRVEFVEPPPQSSYWRTEFKRTIEQGI